ncbi:hypothetical protein Tco_0410546 [Tanacetum coccineum]
MPSSHSPTHTLASPLYSSHFPQIPSPPLPIPPPNGPTYVEGSLGSRAAGIRQRDALPSPIHETEMPEMCLPLRKRPCRTTPGPGYEVGESSAAGTARQLGYGIRDTWDDLVGAIQEIAPTTLEGVNQRVIELSSTVDQEDEIIYSQLDDARYDRALLRARVNMLDTQQSEIVELPAADRRRDRWCFRAAEKQDYRRQRQLVEAPKIVKSSRLDVELHTQQGPAKILQSRGSEEASSSS